MHAENASTNVNECQRSQHAFGAEIAAPKCVRSVLTNLSFLPTHFGVEIGTPNACWERLHQCERYQHAFGVEIAAAKCVGDLLTNLSSLPTHFGVEMLLQMHAENVSTNVNGLNTHLEWE